MYYIDYIKQIEKEEAPLGGYILNAEIHKFLDDYTAFKKKIQQKRRRYL